VIAYVGHGDAPLLADRSDQAAIILKVELSAPSDASISSASKMKPGALAPGTRNLPSSKRSTAAQAKGAVMA
jgi:hypothetical protein